MLRGTMARVFREEFMQDRSARSGQPDDKDRIVDPLLDDLGMARAPIGELESDLQRIQEVVADEDPTECVQLGFGVERIDEDSIGLPEELAAKVREARALLGLVYDAICIEFDPFRIRDLMERLYPFGSRSGLPDGHRALLPSFVGTGSISGRGAGRLETA